MSYMEVLMHDRAIDALYEFVRSNREYPLLQRSPEYHRSVLEMEEAMSDLEKTLTSEQKELLERCISARLVSDDMDSMALFTCGVSVGMELAFCGQP